MKKIEELIEEIGNQIIKEFEENYVEQCDVHTYSDYSGECQAPGVYVDYIDTPDYDKMLEKTIQKYIEDDMDYKFVQELKDYVADNVASENDLYDRAVDEYEPPEPDYEC